jgi:hypothetical protein
MKGRVCRARCTDAARAGRRRRRREPTAEQLARLEDLDRAGLMPTSRVDAHQRNGDGENLDAASSRAVDAIERERHRRSW